MENEISILFDTKLYDAKKNKEISTNYVELNCTKNHVALDHPQYQF